MSADIEAYERQGFGADLQPEAPFGLLMTAAPTATSSR